MSLDKSLKRRDMLQRRRNVLTRAERITRLKEDERFDAEKDSVFALPKVKPAIAILAPSKGPKEEKPEAETGAEAAAAPAAPAAPEKKGRK